MTLTHDPNPNRDIVWTQRTVCGRHAGLGHAGLTLTLNPKP